MKRIMILFIMLLVLAGCGKTNGLLGTDDQHSITTVSGPGTTPEDVIKLYLHLNGFGQYVMAYELLTDEQKRETTMNDLKSYAEAGKIELEKILSIQEKGNVSLVNTAVKFTDQKTQDVRYEVQCFVLKKQEEEWRIINENLLNEKELITLKKLASDQVIALKNNKEIQEFMLWMKEENAKLAVKAMEEIDIQVGQVKDQLKEGIKKQGADIRDGVKNSIIDIKNGLSD